MSSSLSISGKFILFLLLTLDVGLPNVISQFFFSEIDFTVEVNAFLNKCDELERKIVAEYYQRCFGEDLPESSVNVKIS